MAVLAFVHREHEEMGFGVHLSELCFNLETALARIGTLPEPTPVADNEQGGVAETTLVLGKNKPNCQSRKVSRIRFPSDKDCLDPSPALKSLDEVSGFPQPDPSGFTVAFDRSNFLATLHGINDLAGKVLVRVVFDTGMF
jgi:hypothetical protein